MYEYQASRTGHWNVLTQDGEYAASPESGYQPPAYDGTTEGETTTPNPEAGWTYVWRFDPWPPLEYRARTGTVTEYYDYDELGRLEEVTTDALDWALPCYTSVR